MSAPEGNQFAVGNEGGHPSAYGARFLKLAKDYLVKYPEKPYEETIPTIEGLSIYTGVARSTLYNWIKDNDKQEFLDIYDQLMSLQGLLLTNNGVNGKFAAVITKLMLSKHGYIEKLETKTTLELDEPDPKEKAKLNAILNGTQKTTTEQAGNATSSKRDTSPAPVPDK